MVLIDYILLFVLSVVVFGAITSRKKKDKLNYKTDYTE